MIATSLPLRKLATQICAAGPGRRWGKAYYGLVARRCAENLGKIPGVRGVALRGGALRNPVPGISDVDLTLTLEEGLSLREKLRTLDAIRAGYRRLKSRYLVLGELIILFPSDLFPLTVSKNSLLLSLSPQEPLWGRPLGLPARFETSAKSRFINALEIYQRLLAESSKADSYHRKLSLRLVGKISALAGGEMPSPGLPPSELLAEALLSLEKVAALALREVLRLPPLTVTLDFAEAFLGQSPWKLLEGERIFLERAFRTPGPYLGPNALALVKDGITTGIVSQILSERTSADCEIFRTNLHFTLRDRFIKHFALMPYHLVASPPAAIIGQLHALVTLTMYLLTRRYERQAAVAKLQARSLVPITAKIHDRVMINSTWDESYPSDLLSAREEMANAFLTSLRA